MRFFLRKRESVSFLDWRTQVSLFSLAIDSELEYQGERGRGAGVSILGLEDQSSLGGPRVELQPLRMLVERSSTPLQLNEPVFRTL
jgi:hypothetical protein